MVNNLLEKWLDTRGGRDLNDLYTDEYGSYVLMGGRDGLDRKVYIPSPDKIERDLKHMINVEKKYELKRQNKKRLGSCWN